MLVSTKKSLKKLQALLKKAEPLGFNNTQVNLLKLT